MNYEEKRNLYRRIERAAKNGKFPSLNHTKSSCCYRGENGKQCVVGCLIPNKEFKIISHKNSASIDEIYYQIPSLKKYPVQLLSRLQRIHDSTTFNLKDMNKRWNNRKFLDGIKKEIFGYKQGMQ